ncbi:stealth family protein [Streptomyces sp. ACA25]|uniref:stealth family protein n=1 Tax=Streptomyces sp. ACA25 TaxID=3022596 RepID=UPI00230774BA|nr:stealth family protein [Streptomyces sp. ACA25]MDB1089469.1 stealth family protein [Streptomyces sp. ACA25]
MTASSEHDRITAESGHRNPEVSLLVSLYRRTVPTSARRAVAGRLSPQLRESVKRSLASSQVLSERLADRRADRALRQFPALFSGHERRLVQVKGHPKAAHVREFPSPLQAQTEALRLVTATLAEAGIDYFCVRGTDVRTASVGVAEADRRAALRALVKLCAETAGYIAVHRRRLRKGPRRTVPGNSAAAKRQLPHTDIVDVRWYFTDHRGQATVGERYGCTLEFWQPTAAGTLAAPRRNKCTEEVAADTPRVQVPLTRLTQLLPVDSDSPGQVQTLPEFAQPLTEDVSFPVDAVYTWVDGSDPAWLRRRAEYSGETYHVEAANAARYLSRDELRYSLRSLHQYAPWIRHVYLVTDDQTPEWLDTSHPGITVVSHQDIFSDASLLPTFNSHAIESQLHHIDGLAEHFLYLNDDVFFGQLTVPQNFFLGNGLTRFFLSRAHIPHGLPSPDDVPVSVAGKNNRALLERRFGTVITQKMKHVPHALRRSVLHEIEEEFKDRHRATAANRFRNLDDLSVTSSLHHYYSFLTGRAVSSGIRYDYFDMAHPHTPTRLGRLLAARNRMVFCLNDTVSDEADLETQLAVMDPFLRAYFPFPSPYERTGTATGQGSPPPAA